MIKKIFILFHATSIHGNTNKVFVQRGGKDIIQNIKSTQKMLLKNDYNIQKK